MTSYTNANNNLAPGTFGLAVVPPPPQDMPKRPGANSSAAEMQTYLQWLARSYPNGPRLHERPIAYFNMAERDRSKFHYYKVWMYDEDDQPMFNEDGSRYWETRSAGAFDDYTIFDTLGNFTHHATQGKNLQVGLFCTKVVNASGISGWHPEYDENDNPIPNKLWSHAWVGVIAKMTAGGRGLFIFDSDVPHDIWTGNWDEQTGDPIVQRRNLLLKLKQKQLFQQCTARGINRVFLADTSQVRGDDECFQHALFFIESLMSIGGDATVNEPIDNRFATFAELTIP